MSLEMSSQLTPFLLCFVEWDDDFSVVTNSLFLFDYCLHAVLLKCCL